MEEIKRAMSSFLGRKKCIYFLKKGVKKKGGITVRSAQEAEKKPTFIQNVTKMSVCGFVLELLKKRRNGKLLIYGRGKEGNYEMFWKGSFLGFFVTEKIIFQSLFFNLSYIYIFLRLINKNGT
jgi:hypothetical protein